MHTHLQMLRGFRDRLTPQTSDSWLTVAYIAPPAPVSSHSLEPKPKWDAHQMSVLLTNLMTLLVGKGECRCHQKETNVPLSGFDRR